MSKRTPYAAVLLAVLLVTGGAVIAPLVSAASGSTRQHTSYEQNHYSDFFNEQTLAHSVSVNYTQYKAYSASTYVYSSGTWVDTNIDDHKQYSGGGYTVYQWPTTKNPRIIIKKTGSTPSPLVIGNVRVYSDNDDTTTNKYLIYAFNTAWDYMKSKSPFYVPPSPSGLTDASSSAYTKDSISDTKEKVTYNDGRLPMGGGQHTDAATWRWDIVGAPNSGWYWTAVNRKVSNGYVEQAGVSYTYTKENTHSLQVGTSFCVYRDTKSTDC